MNRRFFLSTSMLSGIGLLAARSASALNLEACEAGRGSVACGEYAKHQEVLAQLDAMLASKGLDEQARKVALAAASCPFCGQPLVKG